MSDDTYTYESKDVGEILWILESETTDFTQISQETNRMSFNMNGEQVLTIEADGTFWAKDMEQIKDSGELYKIMMEFFTQGVKLQND